MSDLIHLPAVVQTPLIGTDLETVRDLFTDEKDELPILDESYCILYRNTEEKPSDLDFASWMNLYTDALTMLGNVPKHLTAHWFHSGAINDQSSKTAIGRRALPGIWLQNLMLEIDYKDEIVEYYAKRFWTLVFTTDLTENQLWRLAKSAWNGAILVRLGVC